MTLPGPCAQDSHRFTPRAISTDDITTGGISPEGESVTAEERRFLHAASGRLVPDNEPLPPAQQAWLQYVRQQVLAYPIPTIEALLHRDRALVESNAGTRTLLEEAFLLLSHLCDTITKAPGTTIDEAIDTLCASEHLQPDVADSPERRDEARCLIFHLLSASTMMFSSKIVTVPTQLYLDDVQCMTLGYTQPLENCDGPLSELLQGFGPLMPTKDHSTDPTEHDSPFSPDSLYVSLLNAKTLTEVGDIHIQWVDNISSHLQFDPESQRLLIFRRPSFCNIHDHRKGMLARYAGHSIGA
jgi:hypothetical protein